MPISPSASSKNAGEGLPTTSAVVFVAYSRAATKGPASSTGPFRPRSPPAVLVSASSRAPFMIQMKAR
jgi:hypothetical protein